MRMRRTPALVLALAAVLASSLAAEEAAAPAPKLVIPQPQADLGKLVKGTQATHTFELRNEGDAPLEISRVSTSCECTVAEYDKVIPPGGSGSITLALDTMKTDGKGATTATLSTNDPRRPTATLTLGAEVESVLAAHPGYARWSTTQWEPEGVIPQTVWARDGAAFRVLEVTSSVPFVRTSVREATEAERREGQPGPQYRVEITLPQDAPVGALQGEVVVRTDHPAQPALHVPISGLVRPVVHMTPPVGNFGEIRLDRPLKSHYIFQNFARDPITLEGVEVSVPGVATEVVTLKEGREYRITLTFSEDMAEGTFEGDLVVRSTSPRAPRVTVPLSGKVVKPTDQAAAAPDAGA